MLKRKRFARMAAFTLLEVIVVTGIMTSQANNYGDVKRIAHQKSCENNLRQLYMAFTMYDMSNGQLPNAKFFPKHPKGDPRSLVKLLDDAYAPMLVCPVFPKAIKDKGLTYIFNDELGGKPLDSVPNPGETWLLMEMNAVSDAIPNPHPGGFHILYADGKIKVQKKIPQRFAALQEKIKQQQEAQDKKGDKTGEAKE